MRKTPPIKIIVHYPQTQQGNDAVVSTINKLDCPLKQKLDLLQAVIDTARGTYQPKKSAEAER